ncbi:MAG TPA: tRNA (adenosine(37)-N6)-dimethylallyltransferase MiaA [Polyangiaceae bacterium]|nr:tRNA (adenosine(37)-N6)-dimethylallyltransferase MiaA [Polyangiaceae bacterium]
MVGPTASGKTELAVTLAERQGGEIVSADSVQVYREFEIGTGKPSSEERARAPHHLIDIVDPLEHCDVARWVELADQTLTELRSRGRTPIVCGGTFLWVRALIFGLAAAPPADPAVRARHHERAEREGRAALHAELALVDPETAARLSPNDFVRVSRALEVNELSGIPMSRWQAEHGFTKPRLNARLVGVARERDELDRRIRSRAEAMFAAGWLDEVRALREKGYAAARAMGSVGYRQVNDALAPGTPIDLPALTDAVVRATRVFARRQRTWLRDQPVEWLAPGALPAL